MLATLTAIQLLLLAQAGAPPAEPRDPGASPPAEAAPADPGPSGATTVDAPLPRRSSNGASEAAPPAPAPARDTSSAGPGRQLSLLSAEPLRGASAGLAWAGWTRLGAMYAVGFSEVDDLGVYLDHDWLRSETRLGLLYRRPIAPAGPFELGGRLSAAIYWNHGATYFYDENHSDRGLEVTPGLVLSRHGAGGIFSIRR